MEYTVTLLYSVFDGTEYEDYPLVVQVEAMNPPHAGMVAIDKWCVEGSKDWPPPHSLGMCRIASVVQGHHEAWSFDSMRPEVLSLAQRLPFECLPLIINYPVDEVVEIVQNRLKQRE